MKTTIELAREVYGAHTEWTGAPLDRLEQLVALVRADEREACAKVCEDDAWRCKKIAVETQNKKANAAALEAYLCAEAIRNRGTHDTPV
jgi:hypothetical protein